MATLSQDADILDLPYPDGAFDVVVAEAVTMFVDRPRAAAELTRVTHPGGRVLPRMARAVPFLGYVLVMRYRPDEPTDTTRAVS